jgi:hypothetical protein
MIDFVRLRYGYDFRSAAQYLGAWSKEGLTSQERRELDRQRRQQQAAQTAQRERAEAERSLRIRFRDKIHQLDNLQRETLAQRLDPATPLEDRDRCWHLAALLQDELRERIAGYYLLSFGLAAEREEFVRNPDWRDHALVGVLDRGYVRDDGGHVMEVDFL